MHDHASHCGRRCNHIATRKTLIGLGDRVPSRKKRGQTFYSLCRACLRSPTTGSKLILAGQEEGAVSHPSSREANRSCRADFPVNDEFSCPLTAIRPDGQRLILRTALCSRTGSNFRERPVAACRALESGHSRTSLYGRNRSPAIPTAKQTVNRTALRQINSPPICENARPTRRGALSTDRCGPEE